MYIDQNFKANEKKLQRKKDKALNENNFDLLFKYSDDLADLYMRNQNYKLAFEEYKEAEEAAKKLNNEMHITRAYRMMGETLCLLQKFEESVKYLKLYLEIARKKENMVEEQRALATLGRTYFIWAESFIDIENKKQKSNLLESSRKYYDKSLNVCDRLMSTSQLNEKQLFEMKSRLFLNLGLIFESQGNLGLGIDYISKAISINERNDFREDLCQCYISQGSLYFKRNDTSKALSAFDKGLKIAEGLEDKIQLCELLSLKSDVLIKLSDYNGAKSVLKKAFKMKTISIKEKKGIVRKLRIIRELCKSENELLETSEEEYHKNKVLNEKLGDNCVKLENFEKAIEYYHNMLEYSNKMGQKGNDLIPVYFSLSQTYKDNEDYDSSLKYAEMEYNLVKDNPSEACKTLLNMIDTMELQRKHFEKIMENYQKALMLAKKSGDLKLEMTVLEYIITTQIKHNRTDLVAEMQRELDVIKCCLPSQDFNIESENSDTEKSSDDLDIDLSDLSSDSNSDSEEESRMGKKRARRKIPTSTLTRRNEKGETPLHVASAQGKIPLVNSLIKQGHPVNIQDAAGWSPLHEACNHGHLAVVEVLIDAGANVNDRGGSECGGITPLHDAASNGHLEIMDVLLRKGASIFAKTNKGETVLDCLLAWHERSEAEGCRIDLITLSHFHEIVKHLQDCMKKVGYDAQKTYLQKEPSKSVTTLISNSKSNENEKLVKIIDRSRKKPDSDYLKEKRSNVAEAEDYRNTILALRHRHKTDENMQRTGLLEKTEKPALLNTSAVGDDWLEDDLAECTKRPAKRRCEQFIGQPLRAPKNSLPLSTQPANKFISSPVTSMLDDAPNDFDLEETIMNSYSSASTLNRMFIDNDSTNDNIACEDNSSFDRNLNECKKSKNQSSYERSLSYNDFSNFIPSASTQICQPDSTCMETNQAFPDNRKAGQPFPRMLSIKVRIQEKLFLVPIPQNQNQLNIGWLVSEATRRYRNSQGVTLVLSLATKDGALLDVNDPISILVDENEVCATVLSEKLAPLVDMYKEECSVTNTVIDEYLEILLKDCQDRQQTNLQIKNVFLTIASLTPVLKAISFHQNLQKLCLSAIYLEDQGFKIVIDNISKLPHLRSLDVSVNHITNEGLVHFSSILAQHSLQTLQELDLSYNPLEDDSVRCLVNITLYLSDLRSLNLTCTGITARSLYSVSGFTLDRIESLEISRNRLERDGAAKFLSSMNPSEIRILDMSDTGSSGVFGECLLFLDRGHLDKLEALKLSNLNMDDDDVDRLSRSLMAAAKFTTLDLSNNRKITDNSFKYLSKLINLKELNLTGCELTNTPDELVLPFHQLMCSSTYHGSKFHEAPYNFVTNINEANNFII